MTREEALSVKNRLRAAAEKKAAVRTRELRSQIPELRETDDLLASFGPRIVAAAFASDGTAMEALKEENLRLQKKRGEILLAHGFRAEEDAPDYACKQCGDTGYNLLSLCDCVKALMASDSYRSSGLGKGLAGKTFDSFSLDYYQGQDAVTMGKILAACRAYADSFEKDSPSLLFLGKTGLGKTHLSAAIADAVARKGFRVVYETSQKLFDTYENSRFGKQPESQERAEEYESCDLLLIDDLGAECASQYTSATFFNLLNTRLIHSRPIIISTNLNNAGLEKAYGERILSRLLGEFRLFPFTGQDVRMQKLLRRSEP
ncbi:MAG: ATP-binding protein [Clostridia bacterium]|nr:ATP-binding protein [Clostridia bacterium]